MAGEWTILIWALVIVIFLTKSRAVADFLSRISRQPRHIQGAVLAVTILATIQAFEKSTNETEMVTIKQAALTSSTSSFIPQPSSFSSSSLPAFWHDDATDTDEDGIPDLWEKWTHGNRAIADSGIDRDDDGLTDLEEFQNQTDPRTADTDGDGFSDSFEVANGMNPIVPADFTPIEPDTNNNGLPDIWDQAGYGGYFYDADHDGFDDAYEIDGLPAASDTNFDVLIDVYTTRSAVLVCESGEDWRAFIFPPTTGTSVKIRLPFGADTEVKLLPAPYGISPPSGELWKSRMRLSFVPRTGQDTSGTCIVSAGGTISQKVVEKESIITRFPEAEVNMQMLSLDSGDGEWPTIDILRRRYSLIPNSDVYHASGDIVGPFDIINAVNIDEDAVVWSADYGDMSPETGFSSSLTVTTIPPNDGPIIVSATVKLDETLSMTRNATINRCSQHGFSLNSFTVNFAPLPGSNAVFSVTLPGCTHQNDLGWLEAEIVRETTAGSQHVAWVDMDISTPGTDRFGDTADLQNESVFAWDGIAQAGLSLSYYDETFTHDSRSFQLAAPAVVAGQPVPPPYYTLVVRLWNPGKMEVLGEFSRKICVQQIVQVKWMSEAETLFRTSKVYKDLGQENIVYSADYAGNSAALMLDTLARIRAYYPSSVNIRFVPFFSGDADTTKFLYILPDISKEIVVNPDGEEQEAYEYGLTSTIRSLQKSATGVSDCYFGSIYNSTYTLYKNAAERNKPYPFPAPVSSTQMLDAICKVSAHEVGHALGLVDTTYLDGVGDMHNPGVEDQSKMMNVNTDLKWLFNSHPAIGWRILNSQYLEFVLPIPK